ncbi:MAG: RNA-binding transcriptional accessory protein [Bacteroidales bacterium]|jgi:uncharacterized protein|nr:RNA-binding transcriptional accessory protein [Bacteroidales bacterium]
MLKEIYIDFIADKLSVKGWQIEHCVKLLEDGATVPFISRYRKEMTGALDDAGVAEVKHYFVMFSGMEERKEYILKTISDQNMLSHELEYEIKECVDAQVLEDLFLPFKPKRKTRASAAREKGLEPLAEKLLSMMSAGPEEEAAGFISDQVADIEEIVQGAADIIAEKISEDSFIRGKIRGFFQRNAVLCSKIVKGKNEDGGKYSGYFNFSEKIANIPSFRLLAMLRGESEGILTVKLSVDNDLIHRIIAANLYKGKRCRNRNAYMFLEKCIDDAYKRLLYPSIQNEVINKMKEKADYDSVGVFGENLRQLLLAPPVGQKRTMAIDPGFRTGCKVVCLDERGNLLYNDVIYPHPPVNEKFAAMKKVSDMVEKYHIEIIAVGNGTAGRETEAFIKRLSLPEGINVYSVSEDGASIYSASPVAREEFPDYDVTVRGAVSIGRRLMDPLAELVKIDPKSLGIGQYQHDVNQTLLKEKLDEIVESCVNSVGVNLNTASKSLLSYVSGIGASLAVNIVDYRRTHGAFNSRRDLLNVKRLGTKAFEQAAGFLRINGGDNPLDNSAVHPERYDLVARMADDIDLDLKDIIGDKAKIAEIDLKNYVSEEVGMPTLLDIAAELAKPGRDPRGEAGVFEFSEEIHGLEDLKEGMVLPGIITNITKFGAFVDIGIKQNGLIHVSNLSDRFVRNPSDIVKLRQHVSVKVLSIDNERERIQLKLISSL